MEKEQENSYHKINLNWDSTLYIQLLKNIDISDF